MPDIVEIVIGITLGIVASVLWYRTGYKNGVRDAETKHRHNNK